MKHECYIGIRHDYDNTSMVTLGELKRHIEANLELIEHIKRNRLFLEINHSIRAWTMADYCDRRKSTDLIRFNHCPSCGNKIDWKAIKGGAE